MANTYLRTLSATLTVSESARQRIRRDIVEQSQCHVADGTCGHRTYKYDSCQDERIDALEPDNEVGSVDELGWFGLVIFWDNERRLFGDAAAIVQHADSGAVAVMRYDDADEAQEAWDAITEEYEEYWEGTGQWE